jgi:D-alanine-D-alanine ligase
VNERAARRAEEERMRVLVLMGGSSTERDISLVTGRGVMKALQAQNHEVVALDPATGKRLELSGLERRQIGETPTAIEGSEKSLVLAKSQELGKSDVVFIALHGGIGEDGTLQALLDLAGVAYTGSGMLASALAMDKQRAKTMFRAAGIPTPRGRLLTRRDDGVDPDGLGGFPIVVKPNREGSSVGVHIVRGPEEMDDALDDAFRYGSVLVEEYIPGREITVAVLGGKALPVVEVIPEEGFYDYRHKYTKGETRYEVPARIPRAIAGEAARLGELAYSTLGCAGVARVDFRLTEEGNLFVLEVNTIPGMTEVSLVPMAAAQVGMEYPDLVDRLLELALERRERRAAIEKR